MSPVEALAVATAAHAGFQVTVTALVYPQLARVGPEAWPDTHARHSRLIVPLVALTYAALAATGVWSLVSGPGSLEVAAIVAAAACVAVTATLAAPVHGRLDTPDPVLLRRLLRVDRVRAVLAVAALVLAGAALTG